MKKTILHIFAVAAVLLCATASYAQGLKIYTKTGNVLNIPAADLDRIEAYDSKADYEGTWKMKTLVTDAEYMANTWVSPDDYPAGVYPAFNAADELTISEGKIIPNLKSELSNFFIGEATYEEVGTYTLRGMTNIDLTILKVKGVNRNFSATSKSDSDEAYIGVRVIEDEDAEEAGVYLLDVYLIDYVPTDFAATAKSYLCYVPMGEEPYYAAMYGCYINFVMGESEAAAPVKKEYEGTWGMKTLVTDAEYMANTWMSPDDYPAGVYPAFNAADELTISNGKIIPNLKSELSNFFIGEATYEEVGPYTLQGMTKTELTILKVKGVNRNFSATSRSDSDEAYIGVRVIEDEDAEEAGVYLLDVYLIDYVPTDFAASALSYLCYVPMGEEPYYAAMYGCYINFLMNKK